jgi:hypothetical protein
MIVKKLSPRWQRIILVGLTGFQFALMIALLPVLGMGYQLLKDFRLVIRNEERVQKALAAGDQSVLDMLAMNDNLILGFLALIIGTSIWCMIAAVLFAKVFAMETATPKT